MQTLIRVFDVAADGSLSNGRIFASGIRSSLEPGVPDGMKCDQRGNVWVTAPGGVWVYAPSGDLLGKVRVPENVANLAWGGPEFRTLFLTATHSVYRIETKVGPRREPYMSAEVGDRRAPPSDRAKRREPAVRAAPRSRRISRSIPRRCALIIQDMQNDVMMDGGAFASSGAPAHAREQNVVENIAPPRRRRPGARRRGDPCLVRRRARRAGADAQRAAVRRDRRHARRWCAAPGARRRSAVSSPSPATSWSRRCA